MVLSRGKEITWRASVTLPEALPHDVSDGSIWDQNLFCAYVLVTCNQFRIDSTSGYLHPNSNNSPIIMTLRSVRCSIPKNNEMVCYAFTGITFTVKIQFLSCSEHLLLMFVILL